MFDLVPILSFFALIAITATLLRQERHPALITLTALGGALVLWGMNSPIRTRLPDWLQAISMIAIAMILWRRIGIQRIPLVIIGCLVNALAILAQETHMLHLRRLTTEQTPFDFYKSYQFMRHTDYLVAMGFILVGIGLTLPVLHKKRHYTFH